MHLINVWTGAGKDGQGRAEDIFLAPQVNSYFLTFTGAQRNQPGALRKYRLIRYPDRHILAPHLKRLDAISLPKTSPLHAPEDERVGRREGTWMQSNQSIDAARVS